MPDIALVSWTFSWLADARYALALRSIRAARPVLRMCYE